MQGIFPTWWHCEGWLCCDVTWAVLALSLDGVHGTCLAARGAGLAQHWARQAVCGNGSLARLCSQADRQGHRGLCPCPCVLLGLAELLQGSISCFTPRSRSTPSVRIPELDTPVPGA